MTIGTLPARSSLLLHGEAAREPPTRAARPAFEHAVRIAADAHAGYADAVFHAGEHAASELRFATRPSERLLDALRRDSPRDLLIEWGEPLLDDRDRYRLTLGLFGVVREVPDTGSVCTGMDDDGRLTVDYDGTAEPQMVAAAIRAAPACRTLFVDGEPPTEVRVRQVRDDAPPPG